MDQRKSEKLSFINNVYFNFGEHVRKDYGKDQKEGDPIGDRI